MNRFAQEKKTSHPLRSLAASAIVLSGAIVFLMKGSGSVSQTMSHSQADSLKQAILRSAVHCYAAEGMYPESLTYLKEHYGISWNEKRYVVDYEITGSNRMPLVTVIPLHR